MIETPAQSIVTTRQGAVRGSLADGIHVFKGVPYAAPPFGEGRFGAPRPSLPWSGVRDATREGAQPPQLFPPGNPADGLIPVDRAVAGEDCLNLNIWTPEIGAAGLPVFVWITGGMFEVGSASWYDGSRFARDGVVFVSINYRVGVEGFLAIDGAISNRGLLDQIAALDWIRENIRVFGGDPDTITVCGESAGAMCIGTLLAVPRTEGLIQRAICQSGAAHPVLPIEVSRRVTGELASALGVAPTLEALSAVPFPRMLEAQAGIKEEVMAHPDPDRWGMEVVATSLPFQPVVDGEILPDWPVARIGAGASRSVDLLVGSNVDDWRIFRVASGDLARISDEVLAGPVARHGHLSARSYGLPLDRALPAYRAAYPAAGPGELLVAIQTDWWCRIPGIQLAEAHASADGRAYMYEFGWRSPAAEGAFGACHALEIPFVFDTLDLGPRQMLGDLLGPNPPADLARRMHRAWVAFARHGNPGWPEYLPPTRTTIRFGEQDQLLDDPRRWERELWATAGATPWVGDRSA